MTGRRAREWGETERGGKEGKVEVRNVQFINAVIQNPHNQQDKLEKSRRANLADP